MGMISKSMKDIHVFHTPVFTVHGDASFIVIFSVFSLSV